MSWKYKLTFASLTIILVFICYLFCKEFKKEMNDRRDKKVWVNKEHTACHFQDTLEVNGVKYLKVYDRENAGLYGSPYLIEVK